MHICQSCVLAYMRQVTPIKEKDAQKLPQVKAEKKMKDIPGELVKSEVEIEKDAKKSKGDKTLKEKEQGEKDELKEKDTKKDCIKEKEKEALKGKEKEDKPKEKEGDKDKKKEKEKEKDVLKEKAKEKETEKGKEKPEQHEKVKEKVEQRACRAPGCVTCLPGEKHFCRMCGKKWELNEVPTTLQFIYYNEIFKLSQWVQSSYSTPLEPLIMSLPSLTYNPAEHCSYFT